MSLQIPSLKVNARVVPVSVGQDGALGIPSDGSEVGWWAQGPAPGAPLGTAVIAGHVATQNGPGALFRLRTVRIGAHFTVSEKSRKVTFRVAAIRRYSKAALPWKQIFDQHIHGRLVVITCGGLFDPQTGHYLDNVVVYATPVAT